MLGLVEKCFFPATERDSDDTFTVFHIHSVMVEFQQQHRNIAKAS